MSKVGGNCGIGLFYLVSYDIWGCGDSNCFTDIGVENLEKGAAQNFGNHPFTVGWFLRFCGTLLLGNHFERGILFLLMG